MSDSRVPQDLLDKLQNEIDASKTNQMLGDEEVHDEPVVDELDDKDNPEIPEGYQSLEEYVASGRDPDYYRGPKAYEKDKEFLAEIKEIKSKLKERDEEMLALQQFHEKERQRLLKEIETKKAKAKEELDFEAYEDLAAQERELQSAKKQEQAQGEAPVIQAFRQANPKINPASPEYDPVYGSAFAAAFNAMVAEAERRAQRPLNEAEVRQYLDATAQRLGGSQAQRPPKVEGTRRPAARKDPVAALPPEMKRLYDRWSKDPNKKAWAENLLKQQTGA